MSGTVTSLDRRRAACSVLQLHLEQGATAAWEGVSGAAIVVDGGVVGVVTEVMTNLSSAAGATSAIVQRLLAKLDGLTSPLLELELRDESPVSGSASSSPGATAPELAVDRAPDPWLRMKGRWVEIGPLDSATPGPPPDRVFRVDAVDDVDIRLQKKSSHQYVTLPRFALSAPWGLSDNRPRAKIVQGRLRFDLHANEWLWEM